MHFKCSHQHLCKRTSSEINICGKQKTFAPNKQTPQNQSFQTIGMLKNKLQSQHLAWLVYNQVYINSPRSPKTPPSHVLANSRPVPCQPQGFSKLEISDQTQLNVQQIISVIKINKNEPFRNGPKKNPMGAFETKDQDTTMVLQRTLEHKSV